MKRSGIEEFGALYNLAPTCFIEATCFVKEGELNNYNKTFKLSVAHYVNFPLSAVFSHPEAIRHESLYGCGAIWCYGTR